MSIRHKLRANLFMLINYRRIFKCVFDIINCWECPNNIDEDAMCDRHLAMVEWIYYDCHGHLPDTGELK